MKAVSMCFRHPKFRVLINMLVILLFLLVCLGIAMYMGFIELDVVAMSMLAFEIVLVGAGLAFVYWKWKEIGHRKRMSEIKQYHV